jgi:hypothetical protein
VVTLEADAPIGGTFVLSWRQLTTAPIPFNAPDYTLLAALTAASIPALSVSRRDHQMSRPGYKWRVTFAASQGAVDVLRADGTWLTGTNAVAGVYREVTVSTAGDSTTTVAGTLTLSLGDFTTVSLPVAASGSAVRAALEDLPNVGRVDVETYPSRVRVPGCLGTIAAGASVLRVSISLQGPSFPGSAIALAAGSPIWVGDRLYRVSSNGGNFYDGATMTLGTYANAAVDAVFDGATTSTAQIYVPAAGYEWFITFLVLSDPLTSFTATGDAAFKAHGARLTVKRPVGVVPLTYTVGTLAEVGAALALLP